MPRTLKSDKGRSYPYKRNKQQRGQQRLYDMDSHHSNRITNFHADQISFTKFDCKMKFGKDGCVGYPGDRRDIPYNVVRLDYITDDFNWKEESFEEFLNRKIQQSLQNENYGRCGTRGGEKYYEDALKQIERRGSIGRFVSHGRKYKALDMD